MRWLPTLFAAEAIPSAMITFVALLMFLQLGVGWEQITLLCALLMLPWTLKSWVRQTVYRWGHFSVQLRTAELAVFLLLVALAFSFRTDAQQRLPLVFSSLFVLCLFCAWHELAARMFYEQRLRLAQRRYYDGTKIFFTQAAVVLTYGVLIVGVGSLEVFYHNRPHAIALSWSTVVYALAGAYLFLYIYNLFALQSRDGRQAPPAEAIASGPTTFLAQPHWLLATLLLGVTLLPQALLLHTRVLFLMASQADGGLGCPLQWVGLAQGTVGVIAFSAGLFLGHRLVMRGGERRAVFASTVVPLGLSPLIYWLMTLYPPTELLWLCVATGTAQLCFGYGLNSCAPFLRHCFGERYQSTINYLYIPLVTLVMLPAMAASGWLLSQLGFHRFFALDALLALPAWAAAALGFRLTR